MTDTECGIDWNDAFANTDYIPGGEQYPERWAADAASFRKAASGSTEMRYGGHPRGRLDLFRPNAEPKGLAVFIHGGYWSEFDKSSWSHLAAGPLALGWAVAIPSYSLAPQVRISAITKQVGEAISVAANIVRGPIRLAGHSAGGHLATRMVCETGPLRPKVADRVERVISISGLHDLRPLLLSSMNDKLKLDAIEATAESPALQRPMPGREVVVWVGALERPEFLRQSALLAEAWRSDVSVSLVVDPERHHFDVIDGLRHPTLGLAQMFAWDDRE